MDKLISEQYRIVAKEWVSLDGAARMLEESKTLVLSQRKSALGDIPDSHAEKQVKASPEWHDYIKKMVEARTASNLKKVQMVHIQMLDREQQSDEANKRAEMRLV